MKLCYEVDSQTIVRNMTNAELAGLNRLDRQANYAWGSYMRKRSKKNFDRYAEAVDRAAAWISMVEARIAGPVN